MHNHSISIRAAVPDDFPHIHNLIIEFAAFQKTPEKVRITPAELLADKDIFKCLVAENNSGEMIGFATFFFAYYSWSGKALYLDDLYVRRQYRNQNAGTMLLNEVLRYASESNCKSVRWLVSGWNTNAIAFYKKIGAVVEEGEFICDLKL